MAKKSNNKKSLGTIVKRAEVDFKKKKNPFVMFITVVLVLLAICVIGYSAFNVVTETSNYKQYVRSLDGFKESVERRVISSDFELPSEYNGMEVIWTSSSKNYVTFEEKTDLKEDEEPAVIVRVNQPSYDEGDKEVTLTCKVKYVPVTRLYEYMKTMISLYDVSFTMNVIVEAKEMSLQMKCEDVINNLFMPSSSYESIGFNHSTCYEGVTLSFTSNNTSVLDNNGNVTHPAEDTVVKVLVTAKADSDGSIAEKEYEITILKNDFTFEETNENFDSADTTSKYADFTLGNIIVVNGMIVDSKNAAIVDPSEANEAPHDLKLKTYKKSGEEKVAYFKTPYVTNPLSFSFKYMFDDSKHSTEQAYFTINVVDVNGAHGFNQNIAIKDTFETYEIDLSGYDACEVYVYFDHAWSSDSYVRIDEIKFQTKISVFDLADTVVLPYQTTKNITLPFTTKYGGKIEWISLDSNIMDENGTIISYGNVTLDGIVYYGSSNTIVSFDINITSDKQIDTTGLEIYFIDLGKYGLNDCGECTYIKYKDIDIIVDGGDHFESTTRSICEEFEKRTEDKIIEYMIITHPDSDHIGGLPVLFENYVVDNVYKFAEETFTTQKFKNLKSAYDNEIASNGDKCNVYDVYYDIFVNKTTSGIITISDDIYLKFIDTGYMLDKETNGRSVVFEIYAYNTRVLMTGDADNGGSHSHLEADYLDKLDDIDILKVTHHGTENGTTTAFLEKVKPEVAIICNGNYLGNKHAHPCKGSLERLDKFGVSKIYAITGGGVNAVATNDYAYRGSCSLEESLIDRNGTITCMIYSNGYYFNASLKGEPVDLRTSTYWGILFNE